MFYYVASSDDPDKEKAASCLFQPFFHREKVCFIATKSFSNIRYSTHMMHLCQ